MSQFQRSGLRKGKKRGLIQDLKLPESNALGGCQAFAKTQRSVAPLRVKVQSRDSLRMCIERSHKVASSLGSRCRRSS
jgi:hypothetical protein